MSKYYNNIAVERTNKDCTSDVQSLKLAMVNVYKLDKIACCRHIAVDEGVSLSSYDRKDEARQAMAIVR